MGSYILLWLVHGGVGIAGPPGRVGGGGSPWRVGGGRGFLSVSLHMCPPVIVGMG